MEFIELAKKRYSVRKFTDQPIEKEKLDLILEAGNIAPTAKNDQSQRIYVVRDEALLAKLNELTPCIFGSKTVLAIAYDTAVDFKNPFEEGIRSGEQDVSIVATHIMLEATELGIGSIWLNYFPNTKTAEALGIPSNEKLVLLMPLGYAAEDCVPSPNHEKCKPIEETVRYL